MDPILTAIAGSLGGSAVSLIVAWLARDLLSERLKQSIQHEYSSKLEAHKTELNARVESMRADFEMQKLRTSLFFDHQRTAFATLVAAIAEVNDEWGKHYDIDEGLTSGVPYDAYKRLRGEYQKHQLVLDSDCIVAMQLLFDCYTDTFPIHDGSGGPPFHPEPTGPYDRVRFLQPLIAELFRGKMGVTKPERAIRIIASLGAIRLLNKYHFQEIGLPATGPLKIANWESPGETIRRVELHADELLALLGRMAEYLAKDEGTFRDAQEKCEAFLAILRR